MFSGIYINALLNKIAPEEELILHIIQNTKKNDTLSFRKLSVSPKKKLRKL